MNREIGGNNPPFIIAEMSGNHNQSLDRALEIVNAAAKAGVDAVKLQTFTPNTMTLDLSEREFVVTDPGSLWAGRTLYDLYREAQTPWEWHKAIFDRCSELGIIGFSTPFDATAVNFLESLNIPCYKIASQEIVDLPLIRAAAATKKPLFLSTGMATKAEIEEAVHTAQQTGCRDLVLLKCTSTYPASPENTNIRTIPHMRELFDVEVGISDHTMGIGVAVACVALGATVIEKHFTLRRSDGGVDSAFSIEPEEMKTLVTECEHAWQALGTISYGPTEKEMASLRYRRSLYIAQDMKAGEIFTNENLRIIRPGLGLSPKYFDFFIGKSSKKDVKRGTPVTWDII
jgi:pseudaminic acid synthase